MDALNGLPGWGDGTAFAYEAIEQFGLWGYEERKILKRPHHRKIGSANGEYVKTR
jgi:hypothetical protein